MTLAAAALRNAAHSTLRLQSWVPTLPVFTAVPSGRGVINYADAEVPLFARGDMRLGDAAARRHALSRLLV
ncbi:hypothetical protein [Bradyrhizobium sp. NAS96.2]|uniref:hypothetical protein n=1 Tax=Bradyrhizobium sp. NAS96.2 TaxID=1680160 RepID=UPI00093D7F47|nr:hypothetical protein [Bradyrhizobium sp. NAS96.2]OKO74866.1 hypothetical protein AC628_21345 [Bradyrhizobium sp. NAS96.2]